MNQREGICCTISRIIRRFLQTEFQLRVDLKMYLNRWTTQTCYFNYSDSGRNLLKATEQNTECIHEVHAQASIFLRQLHVSNILCVRRFYLAHAHVFTTTFIVTCNLLSLEKSKLENFT